MPTTTSGAKTVVKLDNVAGSLTAITTLVASVDHEVSRETDDDTRLGARADSNSTGLYENGDVGLEGPYSAEVIRHMGLIWGATATQTLEVNWAGASVGRRKETAETVFTGIEVTGDIGSVSSIKTTHKVSGAITYADN